MLTQTLNTKHVEIIKFLEKCTRDVSFEDEITDFGYYHERKQTHEVKQLKR